ncbi:PREDICTED: protein-tyrosine sulfotransferase-like isoform X1 [Lupinus angustifolius]|uniref:protein-tyrosine sulfotransferase-like isoform X1 n=1 Tax=Lupinus angustifolius TaxID=3871 RepID=UPI00092F0526|nr:PREDICTED: protein-tyrosine sulfotransferase-like isoform X1 [Lupinus angustifolius]
MKVHFILHSFNASCMDHSTLKFCVLLILVGFLVNVSFAKNDFENCKRIVKVWADSSLDQEIGEDKHKLRDLLFFLHVPRTGGRTYFHCFLKKLYPSYLECPRSYDKLRFDPREKNCRLLVTHDDYSMIPKLPRQKTSVVTILRDPIDRVFSTYEFSIEVAARFLVHPNLTSATQMTKRLRSKSKGVSTLDIWPWKYLVPWMREDLFARTLNGQRDARYSRGLNTTESNDSYDMEDFAMPLKEYINHPAAGDVVHNGATFQVAGLTNNSYIAEAHEVRHCVQKYKILGKFVLQVAKKRLDDMLYVGLTEEHRESATMFANVVGAQVISQLNAPNSSLDIGDKIEQRSFSDSDPHSSEHQNSTSDRGASKVTSSDSGEATELNMTVGELMNSYEGCTSNLRKSYSGRRIASLKRISPVNFSREARLEVSEEVLQEIRSLNDLDIELYEYARAIFYRQHKTTLQTFTEERWNNIQSIAYGITLWKVLPLAITSVFLLFLFLVIVNVRRRTLKTKMKVMKS